MLSSPMTFGTLHRSAHFRLCRRVSCSQSMTQDGAQADQALSSITETHSSSMDQAPIVQTCAKPETSHPSLQIDCRANNSPPDLYHTFHTEAQCLDKEQVGSQEAGREAAQEGLGRRTDRLSRDSRDDTQDPTSSHESSRPECLSPGVAQSYDKVLYLISCFDIASFG